jgi:ATP-dependent RNA helicase MRH4, mitochondrial
MTADPETGLFFLKDIEAAYQIGIKKLGAHKKGRLYQTSIHGRAEFLKTLMRSYDKQGVQRAWTKEGKLYLLPHTDFYLSRCYYILRGRGNWERFNLDSELQPVKSRSLKGPRYSRWGEFEAVIRAKPLDRYDYSDTSTPTDVVSANYRRFLSNYTIIDGSKAAAEWALEAPRKGNPKTDMLTSNKDNVVPVPETDITPKEEEPPEIWRPNQKEPNVRQATFSHPSQTSLAQATKQLRSEWAPTSFHSLHLIKGLAQAIEKVTLSHLNKSNIKPTDIQSLAIPVITKLDTAGFENPKKDEFRSFLIAAETGSGKTLAYLIPLINRLKREEEWALKNPTSPNSIFNTHRAASPRAIIIVPTSELAEQIYAILKQLSHEIKFTVCAFLPKFDDSVIRKSILSKYIDVLISTPYRLKEFLSNGELKETSIRYLIIDEADTIFDRSFMEDVNPLLSKFPLSHVVLCTATIPVALENRLGSLFPKMHRIVTPKIHMAPRRIDFQLVLESDKRLALLNTLYTIQQDNTQPDSDVKRAIVFCNAREGVRELYEYLKAEEDIAKSSGRESVLELIPFTRENFDRHDALKRFNDEAEPSDSKKLRILLTTDMGSRGLDTITAKTVILYDVPYSSIDLLHRLGRTARAGTRGRVFMIVSKAEYRGRTKEWVNEIRDRLIKGEALV